MGVYQLDLLQDFLQANPDVFPALRSRTRQPPQAQFTNGSRIIIVTTAASARGHVADLLLVDDAEMLTSDRHEVLQPIRIQAQRSYWIGTAR